MKLKARYM